jgi:hypothetical protein
MDDFAPPPPNAEPLPVADVEANEASEASKNVEYEAYPVRKPEEDLSDFKIQVRASTLIRCRTKLAKVAQSRFPWHEVLLALSTLAAGAFLGALPAGLQAGTAGAIFFYTILPVVAVASFVAYLFLRRAMLRDPADIAADALAELPDPDKTR